MSRSTISTFKLFEYPDEASARVYLEGRLWPNGVTCPQCKSKERITTRKDGFYRCNACGGLDFTWRTGTIFERSHIPPSKVIVILSVFGSEPDTSPRQLAATAGITDKTACFVLQDLREAAGDFFVPRLDLRNPHYRLVANFCAYRVGDDGSIWTRWVRSKKPRLGWKWKPLKTSVNQKRGGYRYVLLYDMRGKQKPERVCRLVCAAFHGPCPAGMECNHRDGNPVNDAADNLFWGTHSENMAAADLRGPHTPARGERNGNAKLSDEQLRQIVSLRGKMERNNVAKTFGVSPTRVSQIWQIAGKRLTYERLTA